MAISFTGRKADLTPALRELAEEKLGKIRRFLNEDPEAHVILAREKHRHLAEVVAHARAGTLTARATGGDFPEALGICCDRVLGQAKKLHARLARGRRGRGRRGTRRAAAAVLPDDGDGHAAVPPPEEEAPRIVPMGRVPVKPMTVEDALLELEDRRETLLVFRNADSQRIVVMYRRPDGRFGLIEPEA
jgi:putative sigma-54 modulation protein